MHRLMMATTVALLAATGAAVAGPQGTWLTESGETKVRISSCGEGLCGNIVWLKSPSPNAKVGTRLLTMSRQGDNTWNGKLYNYKDGKTYSGKLSMRSENALTLSGCVLGGLICRSQTWSRTR